jgi:hypothetical protein
MNTLTLGRNVNQHQHQHNEAKATASGVNEMNKEIIEEYQRMKKERDALYVRTLNLNIGSGLRMLKDELYVKEANLKKYMWLHNLTDDFTHDL